MILGDNMGGKMGRVFKNTGGYVVILYWSTDNLYLRLPEHGLKFISHIGGEMAGMLVS